MHFFNGWLGFWKQTSWAQAAQFWTLRHRTYDSLETESSKALVMTDRVSSPSIASGVTPASDLSMAQTTAVTVAPKPRSARAAFRTAPQASAGGLKSTVGGPWGTGAREQVA